jgi:putative heme-binding domain-containing protein
MELRAEAIRSLGGFDTPQLSKDLLGNWSSYSPALRNEIVNVLAGRKDWASDLLAAVKAKKVERTELTDNTILRIQALKDNRLNSEIETVWGRFRATPAELNKLIDKMRGDLAAAPGSFERGRLVFDNQCAKCHKFEGRGHEVGPNIEGAGRDIEYLLVNVLDPNRVIGAPYFMRTVSLLNGRVETGVLHAEDGQSITLKTENGVLKQLQKKDIDDIRVQEKSLMPEGLGNNMTVQNFRDLVRYTMANPFITEAEWVVGGKRSILSGGVSGRLALPDGMFTEVAVVATVIAPVDMKVRVQVGSKYDYSIVTQDPHSADKGTTISRASGKGSGVAAQPDQSSVEVRLLKGENRLLYVTKYDGKGESVFLRIHDPDRRLRYPEGR